MMFSIAIGMAVALSNVAESRSASGAAACDALLVADDGALAHLDIGQELGRAETAARSVKEAKRDQTPGRRLSPLFSGDQSAAYQNLAYAAAYRGAYRKAEVFGRCALASYGNSLRGNDLQLLKEEVGTWQILVDQPAQRTQLGGATSLPIASGADERLEAKVKGDGKAIIALFDTGAELSVISATTARQLNLKVLSGAVEDAGSTGASNRVRLAMLGTLELGTAVVKHVPVEIIDDVSMKVGPPGQQKALAMIIGYSVLRTLGSFGVSKDGPLVFNETPHGGRAIATLLEHGFVPLVHTRIGGMPADLVLDTGANTTILNQTFYRENRNRFSKLRPQSKRFSGIGGTVTRESFELPTLTLRLRKGSVSIHNVKTFPDASQFDTNSTVGNMGRDVWSEFRSITLDFRRNEMRFE